MGWSHFDFIATGGLDFNEQCSHFKPSNIRFEFSLSLKIRLQVITVVNYLNVKVFIIKLLLNNCLDEQPKLTVSTYLLLGRYLGFDVV